MVILCESRLGHFRAIEELVEPLLTNSSCLRRDEGISNLRIPPIDLVAMALEVETTDLATAIDIEDDAIRERRSLKLTALSKQSAVGH